MSPPQASDDTTPVTAMVPVRRSKRAKKPPLQNEDHALPHERGSPRKKKRQGESKLDAEKRFVEGNRRDVLKERIAYLVNSPMPFFASREFTKISLTNQLDTLHLTVVATSLLDEITKRYDDDTARGNALRFASCILRRRQDDTDANSAYLKRVRQRNQVYLANMVSDDLSSILSLMPGSDSESIDSASSDDGLVDLDGIHKSGARFLTQIVHSYRSLKVAMYGLFTPAMIFSISIAFAIRIRGSNVHLENEDAMAQAHLIHAGWQKMLMNTKLALRTSDDTLVRHSCRNLKLLHQAVLVSSLSKDVFKLLNSSVPTFSQLRNLNLKSTGQRTSFIAESHAYVRAFKEVKVDRGLLKRLGATVVSLSEVGVRLARDVSPELADIVSRGAVLHRDVWRSETPSALDCCPDKGVLSPLFHGSLPFGRMLMSLCELPKDRNRLATLENDNVVYLKMGMVGFAEVVQVLCDGITILDVCMQSGRQMSEVFDAVARDVEIQSERVENITTDFRTNVWIAKAVRVLTLGILTTRGTSSLHDVYNSPIIALYLNRLDQKTGRRLGRAPLRPSV